MTEKETFDYCTQSFKNFIISFYEKFTNHPEDKFQFEFLLAFSMRAESIEQPEIGRFSLYLSKAVAHYGDRLLTELRKVFEEVIPEDRRLEWN